MSSLTPTPFFSVYGRRDRKIEGTVAAGVRCLAIRAVRTGLRFPPPATQQTIDTGAAASEEKQSESDRSKLVSFRSRVNQLNQSTA